MKSKLLLIPLFALLFPAIASFAHQPRIVESNATVVPNPDVSKAYYGKLSGELHTYTINVQEAFDLYVGILMPFSEDSKKDVSAEIYKNGESVQVLGGKSADWKKMFEFFGQSTYWKSDEYKEGVDAGKYTIIVSSSNNDSKYALAIGQTEAFNGNEIINALRVIPDLKRNFFNESPLSFVKSPFGWGYILTMYILAFVFGLLYRYILKTFAKGTARGVNNNIGNYDRIIRLTIWVGLLIWAITTSWSPWLLFFSGFALFEALFNWCGFYAAIGKNTCPY
jgi:hypothetical protein